MLMPRKVKYRKSQRGNLKGYALCGNKVSFGDYGLQSLEHGWITARQIETARLTLVRFLKQKGKIWIRIFPDKSVTKKPAESRMGKGKGDVEFWVAPVKPGRVLFEVGGVSYEDAKEAMRLVSHKLPVKTRFMERL